MSIHIARRVGIRDFRDSASQLVREVCESSENVVITVDGEPVATLSPIDDMSVTESPDEHDRRLIAEIRADLGAVWPKGVSAADAVSWQRI